MERDENFWKTLESLKEDFPCYMQFSSCNIHKIDMVSTFLFERNILRAKEWV